MQLTPCCAHTFTRTIYAAFKRSHLPRSIHKVTLLIHTKHTRVCTQRGAEGRRLLCSAKRPVFRQVPRQSEVTCRSCALLCPSSALPLGRVTWRNCACPLPCAVKDCALTAAHFGIESMILLRMFSS